MGRTRKNVIALVLVPLLFMGMAQVARAQTYTDYIDQFTVTENGPTIFNDPFTEGSPPPSAPNFVGGTAASYHVNGTMGPENSSSPGQLTINSSGAIVTSTATGLPTLLQSAILGTNVDNSFPIGLKSNDTFSVTGVFDLVVPTSLRSGYGVALTDGTLTNPQYDLVQLSLEMNASGQLVIQLQQQNFVSGTGTVVDSTPLVTSPSYNQIALTLNRGNSTSDAVTGSFYYLESGTPVGSVTTFADTASVFSNEDFTEAEFDAFAAVPEPNTILLLGFGLVGLLRFRKKSVK